VVVGESGHPDQFSYIECWQDAVFSQSTWLKAHLEEACRVMIARVRAASKCREKCKKSEKPILVGDPQGNPALLCVTASPPSRKSLRLWFT
jgi:type II secretory pathway component PulJ